MTLSLKCFIPSCFNKNNYSSKINIADQSSTAIRHLNPSEIDLESSTLIAHGGFSTVHLTRFLGSPAAIKIHEPSQRLYSMFRQELSVLLRTDHPNIVRLLSYADDPDSSTGTLVLEHAPGGTLHYSLRGPRPPTWPQRVSILYQLASALHYLHEGCSDLIIHGDVKASNVLLDSGLSPKLCDFGSARVGFSATVARGMRRVVMGSAGYVDPCYVRTGIVSKKSDVYSFGVVVLEVVTGKEAFCEEEGRMLTAELRPRLVEIRGGSEGATVVDERVRGDQCFDGGEALVMLRIAARCLEENPSLRPSMGEVLRVMSEEVPSSTFVYGGAVDEKKSS